MRSGPHAYEDLLANNRRWVAARTAEEPGFFQELAEGQRPPFLFVGCSDSRKPLNTITQTDPGELFIHRNVANQVPPGDPNVQAVLEFAVGVLEVRHVIVCGHTRCGGVAAAFEDPADGLGAVEAWIRPIRALRSHHAEELEGIADGAARADRLAELNVLAQVESICRSDALGAAFGAGRRPRLHGWMFRVETGLIDEVSLPLDRWRDEGLLPRDY